MGRLSTLMVNIYVENGVEIVSYHNSLKVNQTLQKTLKLYYMCACLIYSRILPRIVPPLVA